MSIQIIGDEIFFRGVKAADITLSEGTERGDFDTFLEEAALFLDDEEV